MHLLRLGAAAIAACASAAAMADPAPAPQPMTVAFFSDLQERGPSSAAELAARAEGQPSDEATKADAALNDWKLCMLDAVGRWTDLAPGTGTLVDGALGRCGDLERAYRDHLSRITQGGRFVMDLKLARAMLRDLEESWRLRLTAVALDAEIARRQGRAADPRAAPPR